MSKDEMEAEKADIMDEKAPSEFEPTTKHLEMIGEQSNTSKGPYWDTKHVIGANRNVSTSSEDKVVVRPRFWKRCWSHYRRHWKLYTILAVILLAIGLPILFLVIFPAIAQRMVDDASLPIHSAMIMNPTPSSVVYSLVASLKVPAGVTIRLEPITLSLYTPDTGPMDPYIQVDLPEYHLKGKTTVAITNQTASILDLEQFQKFLSTAVYSENFTLSAAGSTAAYLGILKAPLKLKKNVQLNGLNELKGFAITDAAIVFPPDSDGTNLKGNVTLPNPSIVTFELGNVTLNMIVGGIIIGSGRIDNVLLKPGNNTVPIRATVDIKTSLRNLPAIIGSQANALRSGNIEVSASGNSTIYNGEHIPYYEAVLNNLKVTTEVPLIQILLDTLEDYLSATDGLMSGILGLLNGTNPLSQLQGGAKNSSDLLSSLGL